MVFHSCPRQVCHIKLDGRHGPLRALIIWAILSPPRSVSRGGATRLPLRPAANNLLRSGLLIHAPTRPPPLFQSLGVEPDYVVEVVPRHNLVSKVALRAIG